VENSKKIYNAILVSGYGACGSGAVKDLLKEFDSFFDLDDEFWLIFHPDGIMNLESVLVDNWTEFNSDWAIRRFRKLVEVLARPHNRYFKMGGDLNRKLCSHFAKLSNEYIENLIDFTQCGYLEYRLVELNSARQFLQKVMRKISISSANKMLTTEFSCPGDSFIPITRKYLNDLFACAIQGKKKDNIILYDGASPHHTQRCMNYFYSAKFIIVNRDPRDVYMSAIKSSFLPDDTDHFIKRYEITRTKSLKQPGADKNVLRINFEDLVLNYDQSVDKISSFLSLDKNGHSFPRKYFDPEISIKRIGKWKNSDRKAEIEKISRHLEKYLYQGFKQL
jgi:hypothetical protein